MYCLCSTQPEARLYASSVRYYKQCINTAVSGMPLSEKYAKTGCRGPGGRHLHVTVRLGGAFHVLWVIGFDTIDVA